MTNTIINISGGLGNQLFQYALGESLKAQGVNIGYHTSIPSGFRAYSLQYAIPDIELLDSKEETWLHRFYIKNRRKPYLCKVLRLLFGKILNYVVVEDKDEIMIAKELHGKSTFLEGHWQKLTYFEPIKEQLRQKVYLKQSLRIAQYDTYLQQIKTAGDNSVSIHVRRSDYLNSKESGIFNNISETNYYQNALKHVDAELESPQYFIFSDDIAWCKQNLNLSKAVYIEGVNGMKDYHDFFLIRECKHHINANSTFSWWAAYLGEQNGLVTLPAVWFNEEKRQDRYTQGVLLPTGWVTIEE